ncbi:hypothetical protein HOY80DRAFT_973491 [Tuber brumale]|nr:hypothetical protein HOY80DRAFT_973491 [Tuber brumale]
MVTIGVLEDTMILYYNIFCYCLRGYEAQVIIFRIDTGMGSSQDWRGIYFVLGVWFVTHKTCIWNFIVFKL